MARRKKAQVDSDLRVPPPRPQRVASANGGILPLAGLLPGPVAWVLAGGGAHGAVQLGSLQAVDETDCSPTSILGSSAGALTGAVIAEDPVAACNRLAYLWSEIDLTDIVGGGWWTRMTPSSLTKPSLADSTGERASLESVYAARDFEDLLVPFGAVATDLVTGLPVVHETGSLVDALMASSAIPGVLPPVEINGRWFMDALASANLPASIAMRRGAGSIVVFDTGSPAKRGGGAGAGSSLGQVVPALNALLSEQQRISSLRTAAREVPVVYLPTPRGLGGTLSFKDSLESAREAYVLGRDFLIDLVDQYGSGQLAAGLYARHDAFGDQSATVGTVIRPVAKATTEPGGGAQ